MGLKLASFEKQDGCRGHFFENLFIGDMYNRYVCPLQPCRHLALKLLIQGHPRSAEVTHIADFKSVYISLIIDPRGLQCETNL